MTDFPVEIYGGNAVRAKNAGIRDRTGHLEVRCPKSTRDRFSHWNILYFKGKMGFYIWGPDVETNFPIEIEGRRDSDRLVFRVTKLNLYVHTMRATV